MLVPEQVTCAWPAELHLTKPCDLLGTIHVRVLERAPSV